MSHFECHGRGSRVLVVSAGVAHAVPLHRLCKIKIRHKSLPNGFLSLSCCDRYDALVIDSATCSLPSSAYIPSWRILYCVMRSRMAGKPEAVEDLSLRDLGSQMLNSRPLLRRHCFRRF